METPLSLLVKFQANQGATRLPTPCTSYGPSLPVTSAFPRVHLTWEHPIWTILQPPEFSRRSSKSTERDVLELLGTSWTHDPMICMSFCNIGYLCFISDYPFKQGRHTSGERHLNVDERSPNFAHALPTHSSWSPVSETASGARSSFFLLAS